MKVVVNEFDMRGGAGVGGDTDYIASPDDAGNNPSSNAGFQHGIRSTSILAAAQSLAMALQQQSSSLHPSPDPITADIINTWLDFHLPRIISEAEQSEYDTGWDFIPNEFSNEIIVMSNSFSSSSSEASSPSSGDESSHSSAGEEDMEISYEASAKTNIHETGLCAASITSRGVDSANYLQNAPNKRDIENSSRIPRYQKVASTSAGQDSSQSLQTFPSPRSRCHPVISDVTRLETIRERNSVYSEDGEFIDLPLPPVPTLSNISKGEVSAVDSKHDSHSKGSDTASEANAYLQSRLRDFEEADDAVTSGVDGIKKSIRSLVIDCGSDADSASDLANANKTRLLLMEEDVKSIDSSTASNTLHRSAWSVASIGSTGVTKLINQRRMTTANIHRDIGIDLHSFYSVAFANYRLLTSVDVELLVVPALASHPEPLTAGTANNRYRTLIMKQKNQLAVMMTLLGCILMTDQKHLRRLLSPIDDRFRKQQQPDRFHVINAA
uniref:Uncharacterized protein n=1 Tax=Anopheles minimus TaxID=112268 RepID=A0A182W863_9DIPT